MEKQWIEHALTLMEKNGLSTGDALVWAAYHALQQSHTEDPLLYVHYCHSSMRSQLLQQ